MHIFIPCRKHLQSFKTIGGKLQEELRPHGTKYISSERLQNDSTTEPQNDGRTGKIQYSPPFFKGWL